MVRHLCSLSQKRLIVSFAPYTPLLALLKRIGQFFPGSSKTTRAYTLRAEGIVRAANECGFQLIKSKLNADKSGKSKHRSIYFTFDSGDYVTVECYDWSKKMGYWDNLRIGIITNEFNDWLNNSSN